MAEKKMSQSVTLVAPENMEILDFCVGENGKHRLVKKSGIWIGSLNCVQSESGQILSWGSRAWRKFICKLHPIFGEIAPFSNSSPDAELTQSKVYFILTTAQGYISVFANVDEHKTQLF